MLEYRRQKGGLGNLIGIPYGKEAGDCLEEMEMRVWEDWKSSPGFEKFWQVEKFWEILTSLVVNREKKTNFTEFEN